MPKVNDLPTGQSTAAFVIPRGAEGFTLWSEQAVPLRVRVNAPASATAATMGFLIPAGSSSAPKGMTRYFVKQLDAPLEVQIFHSGGSTISSGVGYEIFTR
jgi:hypothetical protein